MSEDLLRVENLRVAFPSPRGMVQAVSGVSFSAGREKTGIVGESGSGKSVTGRSVLRLLPPYTSVQADSISFDGCELTSLNERQMRTIRGRRISMVMQDPKYSLNPVRSVGRQIHESCAIHLRLGHRAAKRRTLEMLEAVRIREPERVYDLYPHEVSGGMGQRIMIAMMLVSEPDLLIADEPTSALDVTVQLQVLAILDDIVRERGMGLLFISHDLSLVSTFCDRVIIMYGGRIMEEVAAADLYKSTHPYTRGLLNCLPKIEGGERRLSVLHREDAWLRGGKR
jgi:peptide/nickel transport system ATP-binding protein